jgi:hypothetical protein
MISKQQKKQVILCSGIHVFSLFLMFILAIGISRAWGSNEVAVMTCSTSFTQTASSRPAPLVVTAYSGPSSPEIAIGCDCAGAISALLNSHFILKSILLLRYGLAYTFVEWIPPSQDMYTELTPSSQSTYTEWLPPPHPSPRNPDLPEQQVNQLLAIHGDVMRQRVTESGTFTNADLVPYEMAGYRSSE